jgi:hypothetical protein
MHDGCQECNRLAQRYQEAVAAHAAAALEFDQASGADEQAIRDSRQRLQDAQLARIRARQAISLHEKSAHLSEASSF